MEPKWAEESLIGLSIGNWSHLFELADCDLAH